MFGWFFGRKEVERVKEETKKSFEIVKKDISNVSGWIKHLDSEKNLQKKDIENLEEVLSTIQEELKELKNIVFIMGKLKSDGNYKLSKRLSNRQTAVQAVQMGVQTAVQTPNLDQFSITEKSIIWILLNTDMKLSYDDLATMMNKERSTIRTQINNIKQKNEEIIKEIVEKNGKKRVFIPENIKRILVKKAKVRVRRGKNSKKNRKLANINVLK